jgi:hypothetical protein
MTSATSFLGGVKFNDVSLGLGQTSFKGGGIPQKVGMAYAGIGDDFKIRYENDFMWKGAPVGDGGDKFRTTAVTISYKDVSLGLNLFTGDPKIDKDGNRETTGVNGDFQGTYVEKLGTEKYRMGALYLGYGNYRLGANSESIRNFFQNTLAHCRGYTYPLFRVQNDYKPLLYAAYQTRNLFTSW